MFFGPFARRVAHLASPKPRASTKPRASGLLAAAIAAGALTLFGGQSAAQADENPVSGTGKGIVGGALLGGEIVTFTMGAIGIEDGWPYFVFGAVGAAGGGIGGYYIEGATDAEVPVYMLAGGMALVIPAVIVALNATAYKPPADSVEDTPADQLPEGELGVTITSQADPPTPVRRRAEAPVARMPLSLVDLNEGQVALSVPAVAVYPVYTPREILDYGVEQAHEVRVPVFQAEF